VIDTTAPPTLLTFQTTQHHLPPLPLLHHTNTGLLFQRQHRPMAEEGGRHRLHSIQTRVRLRCQQRS
jgi:hypothetical protein